MLADKYKASIYALAYAKLGNFHDAEDVTQEVFLKAYQKLRTLKRRDNFFSWIYSITPNLCKMWWRARANRPDAEFIADQEATSLARPSMNSHRDKGSSELSVGIKLAIGTFCFRLRHFSVKQGKRR